MRYATLRLDGATRVALIENDAPSRLLDPAITDIVDLINHPDPVTPTDEAVPLHAEIMAPIPRPRRNIFCVGKNYHDHAEEFARSGFDAAGSTALPDYPIVFSKVPETVIASGEPVCFDPSVSTSIDYEGELAVIIGTGGRRILQADAMSHVWGYTIVNDVTARDVQNRMKQWLVGKSFDTFCPMGPWAATRDELDLADTRLRTWVNGELRQDANTRDLIFDVPTIIEAISAGVTLVAGDVIATGTPAGVGLGFTPPRFLAQSDVVTVEVTRLGRLTNNFQTLA